MENASKALIMAGGILIGIIILSIAVNIFVSAGEFSQSYDDKISNDEINEYNNRYLKYAKNLNAQEFVSLVNLIIELNKKYDGSAIRQVKIYVDSTDETANYTAKQGNSNAWDLWKNSLMQQGNEATKTHKYIKVSYNDAGLISALYFKSL